MPLLKIESRKSGHYDRQNLQDVKFFSSCTSQLIRGFRAVSQFIHSERYQFFHLALLSALTIMLLAVPFPAGAESAQLQTFRAQLRQAEQNGMTDMASSICELITVLEEDEALSVSTSEAPAPSPVRRSYFAEIGRANLDTCTYSKDVQFDTICTAAMLRYNDYLAAVGMGAAQIVQEEAWHRHEATAKVYVNGIGLDGFGILQDDHELSTNMESRWKAESEARKTKASAEQTELPVNYESNRPDPCIEGRSCATAQ